MAAAVIIFIGCNFAASLAFSCLGIGITTGMLYKLLQVHEDARYEFWSPIQTFTNILHWNISQCYKVQDIFLGDIIKRMEFCNVMVEAIYKQNNILFSGEFSPICVQLQPSGMRYWLWKHWHLTVDHQTRYL